MPLVAKKSKAHIVTTLATISPRKWYSEDVIDSLLRESGLDDDAVQSWRECLDGDEWDDFINAADEWLQAHNVKFEVMQIDINGNDELRFKISAT